MGSVIIGATSMEQLKANIEAAEITLSEDILADIRDLGQVQVRGNAGADKLVKLNL